MEKQLTIPLYDIVVSLSHAMDLVTPQVVNHHQRVAYIASGIALELGVDQETQTNLILAGLLHDAGAISLQNRLDTLNFEMKSPHEHAERGYLFIKPFEPFSTVARLVRHHHVAWGKGDGAEFAGEPVLAESQILHLADRIDVLIDRGKPILGQVRHVCRRISDQGEATFMPGPLDAFLRLAKKEYFWLDTVSPAVGAILAERTARSAGTGLTMERVEGIAGLFSRVIDFRSRFTAMHSSGVGAIAEFLARNCGMTASECREIRIAGLLHDLGKLSVPKEILEKTVKLTSRDHSIIRAHTFHTYRILERICGFEHICPWAAYHHERLDGSGYPFHVKGKEYSLGSRIVSVADVFAAITEERPYRRGMSIDKALKVLAELAKDGKLDKDVVTMARDHCRELDALRNEAQETFTREYERVERHFKTSGETAQKSRAGTPV